ncbi:hypothetical protein [Paenibacillus monticola]|uniref:Uncharacterized protein n=1 Tax=Paenibacillus monticola TaxID=2666075 RepID=A0A7X2H5R1_9BACL|nr:hypothetical protein [Paenibacillus monticola]MRN53925.1 hypothetical protein [Paenibacillus monticola]
MKATIEIKSKIDELIHLLLTDGVQPSDLTDNIFLDDYSNISYRRQNQMIIGELVFKEEMVNKLVETKLRYYYNLDKKLLRIEEEIYKGTNVIWDRAITEANILDELLVLLTKSYDQEQISRFLSTLPSNLKAKIEKKVHSLIA